MLQASGALAHLNVTLHFWTDSVVVLKWITNPDLHLARFVKRSVDIILRVAPSNAWKYVPTSQNFADAGTRETTSKTSESVCVWLRRPNFLMQNQANAVPPASSLAVQKTCLSRDDAASDGFSSLDKLAAVSPDLYVC